MRVCRFDENRLGIIDGDIVRDVTAALDVLPQVRYPLPKHDPLIANLPQVLARARAIAPSAPALPLSRTPAAQPGRQSRQARRGSGQLPDAPRRGARGQGAASATPRRIRSRFKRAGLFLKANSSLVGAGEGVVIRKPDRRTDHEVELAVVIGKTASHVSRARCARLRRGLHDRPRHHDSRDRGSQLPQVRRIRTRCSGRGS